MSWGDPYYGQPVTRESDLLGQILVALGGSVGATIDPLGFSAIAVLTTAKGLHQGTLGAIPVGTTMAIVQPENFDVRVRTDGTNPTSSVGMLLLEGNFYEFTGGEIAAARFIEVDAGASLNVEFRG